MNTGEKVVIDSNNRSEEIIQKNIQKNYGRKSSPDANGFSMGLDAQDVGELSPDVLARLMGDAGEGEGAEGEPIGAGDISGETGFGGFTQGIKAVNIDAMVQEALDNAKVQADEILENAEKEAENVKENARKNGYNDGFEEGRQAWDAREAEIRQGLEAEYEQKKEELENEYALLRSKMEPELVSAMTDVFSKVFGVMASDRKDMIVSLVNSVLRNTELAKEFIIKVCEADYNFLIANKDMLAGSTSDEIHIDIVKDNELERNQCIIESDVGVFDCSLDIQMENLIKDLKLLSCL